MIDPWQWLIALNAIITLILIAIVAKELRLNAHIMGAAKAHLTDISRLGVEKRQDQARTRIKEEHKGALLDSLAAEIPFASNVINRMRDGGMGDNEILVMLSDPDVLNGIIKVAQGAGVVVDSLKGLIGGGEKKEPRGRARQGEIPLIETKA